MLTSTWGYYLAFSFKKIRYPTIYVFCLLFETKSGYDIWTIIDIIRVDFDYLEILFEG
jgi:hypothetical protein